MKIANAEDVLGASKPRGIQAGKRNFTMSEPPPVLTAKSEG